MSGSPPTPDLIASLSPQDMRDMSMVMSTFSLTPERIMSLTPEYLAQDKSRKMVVRCMVFFGVQIVVFAMYIMSRSIHSKSYKANSFEWRNRILLTGSFLSVVGLAWTGYLNVQIGSMGRHIEYYILTNPSRIAQFNKLQFVAECLYITAAILPKLAILSLYLRIFIDRFTRFCSWILVGVLIAEFSVVFTLGLLICRPIAYRWDPTITNGRCGDFVAAYRYVSIPNITTDIIILFLPLSTIYKLKASRKEKIGIFFTFFFGGMGIIGAICRMRKFFSTRLRTDPTYHGVTPWLLTIGEPTAYFVCACILSMRPLCNEIYSWFRQSAHLGRVFGGSRMDLESRDQSPSPEMKEPCGEVADVSSRFGHRQTMTMYVHSSGGMSGPKPEEFVGRAV